MGIQNHLKSSENTILNLIKSEFGRQHFLVSRIKGIIELSNTGIEDFTYLQNMLSARKAILRKAPASIDATIFRLIAFPGEKNLAIFYFSLIYIMPVVGIILSIINSWFYISISIISPIVGLKSMRELYLGVLFNRAYNSEIIFSFLLSLGKITLEIPEKELLIYKN